MCATTEWTGWSDCSTTCGKGYELRTRRFLNRMGRKKCPHVETMDRRSCAGSVPTCPEPEEEKRIMASPDCAVTSWSEWSPCSVSCGKCNTGCLKNNTVPLASLNIQSIKVLKSAFKGGSMPAFEKPSSLVSKFMTLSREASFEGAA